MHMIFKNQRYIYHISHKNIRKRCPRGIFWSELLTLVLVRCHFGRHNKRWNDRRRERSLHDFFCVVCNWANVSLDRPINNKRNKSCFVSDRQRWSGQLFITRAPLCWIISVALSVHLSCSIGSRQGLSLLPLLFTLNKKGWCFL